MADSSPNPVRLQQLLDQAAAQSPAQRMDFVRRAAAHDPALRDAALAQLALHTSSKPRGRFFARDFATEADASFGLPSELQQLQPGRKIGDFTLVRFLGKGGMGQVWEARQESLKKSVALKLLLPGRIDERAMELFVREAKAGGKCHHKHLVATLARGEDEGIAWLAQELVPDAQTLDDAIDRFRDLDRLPDDYYAQVAALIEKVAIGMQAAHDAGVVHRDLKPQNILLDGDDEPRVADFGLARVGGDSFQSQTGDFAGTYFYMSPEQVAAKRIGLDHRTDVFSLGVVLYELLTLQRPFVGDTAQQIAQQIAQWDPMRADLVRSQCPRDLGVIAEKAMQKLAVQRYPTMAALAADLRRHLDDLPILAKPTGRVERTRKWIRRNPTVSAVMATVVVGGAVAGWLAWENAALATREAAANEQAQANEQRAKDQEQLAQKRAESEQAAKEEASRLAAEKGRSVAQFQQLSVVVRLQDVKAAAESLWLTEGDRAGWPQKVDALKAWLEGPCADVLAQREQIEATIADLRSRALPQTAEQVDADRRASPAFAAYERQQQLTASLRRAQAIRSGTAKLELPELPASLRDADVTVLNSYAWPRVAPEDALNKDKTPQRTTFGEEAQALVAARAAVAKSAVADDAYQYLDTLAWALLANGQDAEAKQRTAEALSKAPSQARADYEGYQRSIDAAIAESAARIAAAEQSLAQLESTVSQRRTWSFGSDAEGESARFLHDALVGAASGLAGLDQEQRPDVARRLAWAQQVLPASATLSKARHDWPSVRRAIAKADGVEASELYVGKKITIPDGGWLGVVPIGMNPVTKLWEFYDLRSAWDGKQDPSTIAIPEHRVDGSIAVTPSTGMIFVLLPGGTFWMGSQKEDPNGPNYDPDGGEDETLHEVTLSPFLMARHEITRAQWERLTRTRPFSFQEGSRYDGDRVPIGPTHPADSVSWNLATEWLGKHGYELPTESQWEYGCRAGTVTAFSTGADSATLSGFANLHDQRSYANMPSRGVPVSFDDGFAAMSPVASFLANAFGLFDMHGNQMEWCADAYGDYPASGVVDPRSVSGPIRVHRGGSWSNGSYYCRAAYRSGLSPGHARNGIGFRVVLAPVLVQ